MDNLIPSAYAQEMASAAAEPSIVASLMPLVLIFAVFYFLLIRPQQKKYKQHQAMVAAIQKNDKVITSGGIHGKVKKAAEGDSFVLVEIAKDMEVKVERSAIATVESVHKPANDNKTENSAQKEEISKKA